MSAPVLVNKPLAQIITFWRPGSHDWTWADEYADLINDGVTQRIEERLNSEGVGFVDHITPVLLGSDGRVWDGHHRIVLAIKRCTPSLMVEIAGGYDSRRESDIDALTAIFDAEQDETAGAPPLCICGHARIDHIHEVGACRPGFVCPAGCGYFTPPAPEGQPEGSEPKPCTCDVPVADPTRKRCQFGRPHTYSIGWLCQNCHGWVYDRARCSDCGQVEFEPNPAPAAPAPVPDDEAVELREARRYRSAILAAGYVSPEAHAAAVAEAERAVAERILGAVEAIHYDAGNSQGYFGDRYGEHDHCCNECGTLGEYGIPWPCPTVLAAREVAAGGGE